MVGDCWYAAGDEVVCSRSGERFGVLAPWRFPPLVLTLQTSKRSGGHPMAILEERLSDFTNLHQILGFFWYPAWVRAVVVRVAGGFDRRSAHPLSGLHRRQRLISGMGSPLFQKGARGDLKTFDRWIFRNYIYAHFRRITASGVTTVKPPSIHLSQPGYRISREGCQCADRLGFGMRGEGST